MNSMKLLKKLVYEKKMSVLKKNPYYRSLSMLAYDSFLDTNLPIYPTIVQPHYLNLNSLSLYKTGVLISINPETQEAANTLKTQARSPG